MLPGSQKIILSEKGDFFGAGTAFHALEESLEDLENRVFCRVWICMLTSFWQQHFACLRITCFSASAILLKMKSQYRVPRSPGVSAGCLRLAFAQCPLRTLWVSDLFRWCSTDFMQSSHTHRDLAQIFLRQLLRRSYQGILKKIPQSSLCRNLAQGSCTSPRDGALTEILHRDLAQALSWYLMWDSCTGSGRSSESSRDLARALSQDLIQGSCSSFLAACHAKLLPGKPRIELLPRDLWQSPHQLFSRDFVSRLQWVTCMILCQILFLDLYQIRLENLFVIGASRGFAYYIS